MAAFRAESLAEEHELSAPDLAPPSSFSHRERVTILIGLGLGMFLGALDQTIVATALPRMSTDLGAVEHLSWVVSAYLLTSTAATPIYGKLSDLYGRRIMLQAAIAIFVLTSVLCALAGTMFQLIVFRALQGIGAGGLISMAHATIADVISPRERGRYQAYIAGSFTIASVIGPVAGGLFVDYLSWRWVFWLNLPMGLIALYMTHRTLAGLPVRGVRHRIDVVGALLMVTAVWCLLLVITTGGNELPWTSPIIMALLAAALIFFWLFVLQERMTSEPILPLRLFANHSFVVSNLVNFLLAMCSLGSVVLLPMFLQLVFKLPASHSGLLLIPLTTMITLSAIVAGRVMAYTGRYKIFPVTGLAMTSASLLLLSYMGTTISLVLIASIIGLTGAGMGLVGAIMMVSIQNAVEVRDLGTATSSVSFFRSMGGAFGVALLSAVLIARLDHLLAADSFQTALGPEPGMQILRGGAPVMDTLPPDLRALTDIAVVSAFQDVFLVASVIAFIALLAALRLREVPLKTGN
jgi:EmrB/QacA subfamily drug resistance transporter